MDDDDDEDEHDDDDEYDEDEHDEDDEWHDGVNEHVWCRSNGLFVKMKFDRLVPRCSSPAAVPPSRCKRN